MKKSILILWCFLITNTFAQTKTFIAKPSLQIGSDVESYSLDILWQTPIKEANWEIVVKPNNGSEKKCNVYDLVKLDEKGVTPRYLDDVRINNLTPGKEFT